GDFNSLPADPTVSFLKQRKIVKSAISDPLNILPRFSDLTSQLKFSSGYEQINGREPEYTNYTEQFTGTLDYIFGNENVVFEKCLEIPSVEILQTRDCLKL